MAASCLWGFCERNMVDVYTHDLWVPFSSAFPSGKISVAWFKLRIESEARLYPQMKTEHAENPRQYILLRRGAY